jgi:hypothetical protein
MTNISRYINDTVNLTNSENLAKSSSAVLELVLSTALDHFATLNLSTNTFNFLSHVVAKYE